MGRPRSFDEGIVIERAMEAFWTHGYGGTSPARLAEATGVAKGSLYNAFSSKRDLFDRCLDMYQRQISGLAQRLLEHPGSTREAIGAALTAVVEGDLANPRGCLIGNTAVELAGEDVLLTEKLTRFQRESTGWFAERILRGQAEGDVARNLDAQALAEHFANTLAGLRVTAMTRDAGVLHRIVATSLLVL